MENDEGRGEEWEGFWGRGGETWPVSIYCAKWDCFIIGKANSAFCVVPIASLHKRTYGASSTNPRCSSAVIPISASLENRNMIVGWAAPFACSESSPESVRRLINLATRWSSSYKLFCEIDLFLSCRWAKQHGRVSLKQTWECLLVEVSTENAVRLCVCSEIFPKMLRNKAQSNRVSMSADSSN